MSVARRSTGLAASTVGAKGRRNGKLRNSQNAPLVETRLDIPAVRAVLQVPPPMAFCIAFARCLCVCLLVVSMLLLLLVLLSVLVLLLVLLLVLVFPWGWGGGSTHCTCTCRQTTC